MAYIGSLYRVITENEQARLRSSREDGNILAKAEGLHTDHPPRRPACTLARIMVSLSAFFDQGGLAQPWPRPAASPPMWRDTRG